MPKKQLDNDKEAILTTARKHLCQMATLKWQQLDGLKTALPFGVRKIDAFRTLTTESLAVFMPFRVQEVYDKHGIYYGQNVISKNMMIACCNDGTRPVIFKIERIDIPETDEEKDWLGKRDFSNSAEDAYTG